MPEKPSEQEPSIEEILASIRQIIADDDEEPAKAAAPEPAPAQRAAPVRSDILDLTEVIRDEPEEMVIDLQEHEEEEEELPPPPPQLARASRAESIESFNKALIFIFLLRCLSFY